MKGSSVNATTVDLRTLATANFHSEIFSYNSHIFVLGNPLVGQFVNKSEII